MKNECQEWDSNPCPFGPVPETGALDQLGHLDVMLCSTILSIILYYFDYPDPGLFLGFM
jgi:hypothetical protein